MLTNQKNRKTIQLIDQYSRLALKVILILLVTIIVVQTLLQVSSIRKKIVPTERYEGHAIEQS